MCSFTVSVRRFGVLVLVAGFLAACVGGGGDASLSVVDDFTRNDNGANDGANEEANNIPADGRAYLPDGYDVDDGDNDGSDHALLGTITPGTNADPAHYQDAEYNYGGYYGSISSPLSVGNFSNAYARGWTGTGSVITIADTGIDTDHPDLAGNILATRDFSGAGIEDNHGHGTHVAGIAAASRNGVGTHGAAFDAKLAIGKVSNGAAFSFDLARQVTAWGRSLGSVAVNVSAAYLRDAGLEGRQVEIAPGQAYLDHPSYGTGGYYGSRAMALLWRDALGAEQVLIKAAGNDGTSYSAGMNQLATASYDDGSMILDGQMLVVGNWHASAGRLIGNQAGNVCVTWQNGACLDGAQIKDFFIMAPGTWVTSTYLDGGYASLTGSSMSVPLVSGAVAVLHQMWPHMKGKNLAKLLLQTADKDILGYEEHVHGQGLLDMDRATQPVGATGLPLDGRTSGGVSAIVGTVSVAGVPADLQQALSGVMVLDEFERDFYIDLGANVQPVDTRRGSLVAAAAAYDGFAPYFAPSQHLSHAQNLNADTMLRVGGGLDRDGYLGNDLAGSFGDIRHSSTAYGLIQHQAPWQLYNMHPFAQFGAGVTMLSLGNVPSLLAAAGPVISSNWAFGVEAETDRGGRIRASISQPVHIEQAPMTYRLPIARTLDGDVRYATKIVDFGKISREIDFGVSHRQGTASSPLEFVSFAELRSNVAAISTGSEYRLGARMKLSL